MRDIKLFETKIIDGIKKYVGQKNVFIGISGGIDSALTAFLCVKALGPKRVFGILMPYGRQSDILDSLAVVKQLKIKYFQKDIKPIVDNYKISSNKFVLANLMSRTRMAILYAYANQKNGLVVGTTNKSEMAIGYFTKFGDGGCDLEPIAELYKYEVFEMFVNDESCVQNGKIVLPKDFIKKFEIENRYENIKLKFCTPLRIKKEEKLLKMVSEN